MKPEDELQQVFEYAKTKFQVRMDKAGNTERPWNDFTVDHLELRLMDEVKEYCVSPHSSELLDIINMAGFLYLARQRELGEDLK